MQHLSTSHACTLFSPLGLVANGEQLCIVAQCVAHWQNGEGYTGLATRVEG